MPCFIKPDMHHTWLCIIPCSCVVCLLCCVLLSSVCFFGVVPVTSRLWGPVHLRFFVFFMDSFFFLAGSQARWPYPQNHFYLCLLVVRSIAMPHYLSLALQAPQIAMKPPLTFVTLPRKPLFGYVTAFCSAPLIALLIAGEDEVCSMLDYVYVGISQYLLFN